MNLGNKITGKNLFNMAYECKQFALHMMQLLASPKKKWAQYGKANP